MCHCSNYDDVELGLMRFSLCLPCLNGISKDGASQEQGVAWLVSSDNQEAKPPTLEDPCGICGMYARAWTRLEMAIYGQDADDSQDIAFCYRDTAAFAFCLPLYGFTIGSLQYAVRSYFGLSGTRRQDFGDACCFPTATILKNEQEIILRERIRKASEGKQQQHKLPYGCYDQMLYPPKLEQYAVRGEQVEVTASDNKAADANVSVKPSPAKAKRQEHILHNDVAPPTKAKRQEHTLHDDIESATPAKPIPHELGATALRTGPL
ncbi:uncharacterized protein TRIVIDRAFT_58571 [Trichoderma virens Gv29-8]|uniref:Uncharacterized protein n=1 Tax=Hypocrea virens (strain Gv29-8 / FGSC 10586) TaxID=413071 RepID=G9MZN7_HYPVG|nr:uncharacterized protein TRIVIDRAFT_58571 [Trichoderma virens Gv29-8]EHK20093.1 hypothetical protein TRIVIDRAFT_58571 [Trichoderma virens Gv29-8]UKZ45964.1 hypothetical protein TrVGV298_000160 [Trichoderma virens]